MPEFDVSAVPCPEGAAPTLIAERFLCEQGYVHCAGLDEVGRGCLAGPVVAAAVILPLDDHAEADLDGVRDSKQLTPASREKLAALIRQRAFAWAVGVADVAAIECHNILGATRLAMQDALLHLDPAPDALVLDALTLPRVTLPQVPLIRGDQRSLSIAAASILAKVTRDRLMAALDAIHPGYDFARHKGYGTPTHLAALAALGPCPQHRRTFAPVRRLLEADNMPQQLSLVELHENL
ncbi:MAG TPA: ribonuclease HII [Ktedonobacterales bacterium]|nr:ribonuclease HII [Ktedonobacterales bacterium]